MNATTDVGFTNKYKVYGHHSALLNIAHFEMGFFAVLFMSGEPE